MGGSHLVVVVVGASGGGGGVRRKTTTMGRVGLVGGWGESKCKTPCMLCR